MLAVRAKSDGLEIEFTEPLREGDGWDPNDWEIKQWRYVPTKEYGGPKVDLETLKVLSASVSSGSQICWT
jgi:cytochrome c